jgi:hypothetical protein
MVLRSRAALVPAIAGCLSLVLTRKSAAQRTTGTWAQTVTSYPENRPDDFSGTFSGAYRKASKRPLPAACQGLEKSL